MLQRNLFDFNSSKKNTAAKTQLKRVSPAKDDRQLTAQKSSDKPTKKFKASSGAQSGEPVNTPEDYSPVKPFRADTAPEAQQQPVPAESRQAAKVERKKFDKQALLAKFEQEHLLLSKTTHKEEADRILSGPSATKKYEDLLQQQLTFILPASYKDLLEVFASLDQILRSLTLQVFN